MTWKNPQSPEFDETGYSEFQRLNVNAEGEIDTAGEHIVRKLFNPSTISVTYKQFLPIILKMWYSEDGSGASTEATVTDTDFGNASTKDPGAFATQVFNEEDYWWLQSDTAIRWSNDGGETWTEKTSAVSSIIRPVKYNGTIWVYETNGQCKRWNKSTNDWEVVGTGWDGNTVDLGGGYELMSGNMLLEHMMIDGSRFVAAYSAEIGDGMELQNVVQFYYSDDEGETWIRGKAVDIHTNQIALLHRHTATQVSIFCDDQNYYGDMFIFYLGDIDFTSPTDNFSGIGGWLNKYSLGNWNSISQKGELILIGYQHNWSGHARAALVDANSNTAPITEVNMYWDAEIGDQGQEQIIIILPYFSENDNECYIYTSTVDSDNFDTKPRIYRKSPIIGYSGFTEVFTGDENQDYLLREIK